MKSATEIPLQGLDRFQARIRAALAPLLELSADSIRLESPRKPELGEFAFPCFQLAKQQGGNPAALAQELAGKLAIEDVTAQATGPFLNFRVEAQALVAAVLGDCLTENYGHGTEQLTSIVEFSSPNIAKPMHAGHLPSTTIGATLARVFAHLGHRVIRINHLGDWGSQFGKLVAAWNRWGEEAELEAQPIQHLMALYVRYHEEEKEDPKLAEEAKAAFYELEHDPESETRRNWLRFTEYSLREFNKIYDLLGIEFDYVRGESWYEDKLDETLQWLESKRVLEESEGAMIVDLSSQGIKTPALVKTAHGTTLYATRDIAAARSRQAEFGFDQSLYVVGSEQKLHFNQLFAVLRRCGCDWADTMEHISFGLIRMAEGKLSTREGRVLLLQEIIDRAIELAREVVAEKNPDHPDPEQAAQDVGLGAIVFHELKHQRSKDVVFDWKEVLSFEGDTGPYVQYTHARCCAIQRKADRATPDASEVDPQLLTDSGELFVALGRFPAVLRETAQKREPMILSQYLLRLAGAANGFYRERRVLGSEPAVEQARLAAVEAVRRTLHLGLSLLGVPAPVEM